MTNYPKKGSKKTITKICPVCGKEFTRWISHAKQTGAKTCSNHCANTGKRSHQWQGNNVSYNSLHKWLQRHNGKPTECSVCGTLGKMEGRNWSIKWASRDGKYPRKLSHYIPLCSKCHIIYDIELRGYVRNQYGKFQLRHSRAQIPNTEIDT